MLSISGVAGKARKVRLQRRVPVASLNRDSHRGQF